MARGGWRAAALFAAGVLTGALAAWLATPPAHSPISAPRTPTTTPRPREPLVVELPSAPAAAAPPAITELDDLLARLPGQPPSPAQGAVRVCLVTAGLKGPVRSGGIATASTALAQHLAAARRQRGPYPLFNVTVLYANTNFIQGDAASWRRHYAGKGVGLVALQEDSMAPPLYGPKLLKRSYRVFQWLTAHEADFDVVLYHDYMGIGFYTADAKRQGLLLRGVPLVCICHSTTRWSDYLNHRGPKDVHSLETYHIQQLSVELADYRVSPSRFFLDWMGREAGYDLGSGLGRAGGAPRVNLVLQNLLHPLPDAAASNAAPAPAHSGHLAFFGRLEIGKGLVLFMEALDRLQAGPLAPRVAKVSFLGAEVRVHGKRSGFFIRQHQGAAKWPWETVVRTDLGTREALAYLTSTRATVVLPSFGDNSPYTVLELLAARVPFLATRVGGIPELYSGGPPMVEAPTAGAIADALAGYLGGTPRLGSPSVPFHDSVRRYIDLLSAIGARRAPPEHDGFGVDELPHEPVDILIASALPSEKPALIQATAAALLRQEPARPMDLAVLSAGLEASVVRSALNAVPNPVVRRSLWEHLASLPRDRVACLLESGVVPTPQWLRVVMQSLGPGRADIATTLASETDVAWARTQTSLALAGSFASNYFGNHYGARALCFAPRRAHAVYAAVAEATGGGLMPRGFLPWTLFSVARQRGLAVSVVPLPLVSLDLREAKAPGKSEVYTGHAGFLNASAAGLAPDLREILFLCRSQLAVPKMELNPKL